MSNVYNFEPPPKGKVTLKTTVGDIDIELWAKEAPKAVRNFVQLCLEGYYDGTIFHRIIKDFMVQGGDPTGTGQGGESAYGAPFKDEFHSRLRFSHRGLVACANQNEPHTNGSQFFITLDKCEWLDKKNAIFGRVAGDTIYNLLKLNEYEVDAEDRPLDPPRILGCEVLWNPFEDIVPRTTPEERAAAEQHKAAEAARKEKKGRKRNLALLSFGEDAEADEAQLQEMGRRAKVRSAHEVLKDDERLAAPDEAPEVEELERKRQEALGRVKAALAAAGGAGGGGGGGAPKESAAERVLRERAERRAWEGDGDGEEGRQGEQGTERGEAARRDGGDGASGSEDDSSSGGGGSDEEGEGKRGGGGASGGGGGASGGGGGERDAVAERMALIRQKRSETLQKGIGKVRAPDAVADADLLKPWQVMREQYKNKKRAIGDRQKDTLARLAAFESKLKGAGSGKSGDGNGGAQELEEEDGGAAAAAAAAAGGTDQGASKEGIKGGEEEEHYAGKVKVNIDHRAYMPAAWRVDDFGEDGEDGGEGPLDLASLRQHRLEFAKGSAAGQLHLGGDGRAVDDYVVFDPLLEAAKGKFSKAATKQKKQQTAWAGRAVG